MMKHETVGQRHVGNGDSPREATTAVLTEMSRHYQALVNV